MACSLVCSYIYIYLYALCNQSRRTSNIDITLNTDINLKLFYINAVSEVLSNIKCTFTYEFKFSFVFCIYKNYKTSVSQMDRVRNEEVRMRAGIERELASRADQRVLRWFGHVERMDHYRMARRVLMAEVSGGRVRRRPRLGWMDGVKVALGNRGMTVEAERNERKTIKSGEPRYICN